MPEGPEHFLAGAFINNSCDGKIFSGKVIKSAVTKNPDIELPFTNFSIYAISRGKELMLVLSECCKSKPNIKSEIDTQVITTSTIKKEDEEENVLESKCENKLPSEIKIIFQFGMSGCFSFTSEMDLPKHSHLMFFTSENPKMVLSFVDTRRFGKWKVSDSFSSNRGPDPVREYELFRKNILTNLHSKTFKKPICEVLNDQMYFNGIGNYLRAEILYRAQIPPFSMAYEVLKDLIEEKKETSMHNSTVDILEYCKVVYNEVLQLKVSRYDPSDYTMFETWLRCYCQPDMNNLVDKDGRTIWFHGPAGPLAPKGSKAISRHKKTTKRTKKMNGGIKRNEKIVKLEEKISLEIPKSKTRKKRIQAPKKTKMVQDSNSPALRKSARIKKE